MEKIRNSLISLIAFLAFFSLYVGGLFVYLMLTSIVVYAALEIITWIKNKPSHSIKKTL